MLMYIMVWCVKIEGFQNIDLTSLTDSNFLQQFQFHDDEDEKFIYSRLSKLQETILVLKEK